MPILVRHALLPVGGLLVTTLSLPLLAHELPFGASFGDRHPEWMLAGESGGIVYLVDHDEPRIDRYDLGSGVWIDPLIPPAMPTAFAVDEQGVVIATGRSLYSASPGQTDFAFAGNSVNDVHALASDGVTLHVSMDGNPSYAARDRTGGTLLERRDFRDRMIGTVFSGVHGRLLGRSIGYSPSDILAADLSESNDYAALQDSPYHGDYPTASRLWLFPDESRVLDDAGMVYAVPELTWTGSVAGRVEGAVFTANDTYVLSDGSVLKLDDSQREIGRRILDRRAEALFENQGTLYAFSMEDEVPTVSSFAASEVTDAPPEPLDLATASFRADDVVEALDGSLLVLSKESRALFRYSPEAGDYTMGYALRARPSLIASALDADAVFVGYDSGAITRLDLASGAESSFANLASGVRALVPFEDRLFANDTSGAWGSFYTLDAGGVIIASIEWRDPDPEQLWIGATREMLRADYSGLTAQSILPDATFAGERESGYDSGSVIAPLVLSPDATAVLNGTGTIFDTATLTLQDSLSSDFLEAEWPRDGFIVSLARADESYPWYLYEDSESSSPLTFDLRTWGERYEPTGWLTFEANGARLARSGERVMLVLDEGGDRPRVLEIEQGTTDVDGDGVEDGVDAYPVDPARSAPGEPDPAPEPDPTPEFGPDDDLLVEGDPDGSLIDGELDGSPIGVGPDGSLIGVGPDGTPIEAGPDDVLIDGDSIELVLDREEGEAVTDEEPLAGAGLPGTMDEEAEPDVGGSSGGGGGSAGALYLALLGIVLAGRRARTPAVSGNGER